MTRKTRRKLRGGADIEAQTNDEGVPYNLSSSHIFCSLFSTKGVGQQVLAHEMRVLGSINEGEPSRGTTNGSDVSTD